MDFRDFFKNFLTQPHQDLQFDLRLLTFRVLDIPSILVNLGLFPNLWKKEEDPRKSKKIQKKGGRSLFFPIMRDNVTQYRARDYRKIAIIQINCRSCQS